MVAALKEPAEDSDDENDDNMETEGDGPLWQLFDQLYNAPNASGMCENENNCANPFTNPAYCMHIYFLIQIHASN